MEGFYLNIMEKTSFIMVKSVSINSNLMTVHKDFMDIGLKIISVDYNDNSGNLNPYDFYLCEPPDKATSDIKEFLRDGHLGVYYAIKVGFDIDVVVLRVISSNYRTLTFLS